MALREDLVRVYYLDNIDSLDSIVKVFQGKIVSLLDVPKENGSIQKVAWALVGKVIRILDKSQPVNFLWKLSLEVNNLRKVKSIALTIMIKIRPKTSARRLYQR
jgi:hypothetical protein